MKHWRVICECCESSSYKGANKSCKIDTKTISGRAGTH